MKEFTGDWFQLRTRTCGSHDTKCQKCNRHMLIGEPKHDIRLMNGTWANGFWEYNICDRCLVEKCQSLHRVFDTCCQIIQQTGHNTADTLAQELENGAYNEM